MSSVTLGTMEDTGPVGVDGRSTRTRGIGLMNRQRKVDILEARDWANRVTFKNPKYRFRIWEALQNGTLNPILERAIWEMAGVIPKGNKADNLADAVRGLTMLLRKPLSEDPLATAKQVEARVVIEQPAQEPTAALPPRSSIVPPARPKRTQGKATLKPGEEELT
jgi:hypothetical protein